MPDLNDLATLGDVGIVRPQAGDRGDQRVRAVLQSEIDRRHRFRRRVWLPWGRRSVALLPAGVLLVTAATAAAASLALFNASPTNLFEHNPQSGFHQTVIPSTVTRVATVRIRGFGPLQYWAAKTQQGGRCWGIRNRAGSWLTLDHSFSSNGSIPGCGPTRKQQVLAQGNSRYGLAPTSVDELSNSIELADGRWWDIYYGIVNANGATAVKDPATGRIAPIHQDQRFILAEPNRNPHCLACDQLRAINAEGKILPANYGPLHDRTN